MHVGVSICIFSYNYEQFIAQAIDSVLSQQTTFPLEIIIGDDCSTDGTPAILKQYQQRYPDVIKLLLNDHNQGGTRNWVRTISQCQGKYIALLDGDDYFIDPLKLKKQFDMLENDSAANLVFSSVIERYENKDGYEEVVSFPKDSYAESDILRAGWFMRTGTLFFRNGVLPVQPPDWVYQYPYRYDTIIIAMLCHNSKALNCKTPMTVWRRHQAGLSYAITRNVLENYNTETSLYARINQWLGGQYSGDIAHYLKTLRTGVVFHALKKLQPGVFFKLGIRELIHIDYSFLFRLFDGVFRRMLRLRNE